MFLGDAACQDKSNISFQRTPQRVKTMSCEECYTLYASAIIPCEMICERAFGEASKQDEEELTNAESRDVEIQVLMPNTMTADDLLADVRLYGFIDVYWKSMLTPLYKPAWIEIRDFNFVKRDNVVGVERAMKRSKDIEHIYMQPVQVHDKDAVMELVKKSNVYVPKRPLLILPNIAYMIPPDTK